MEVFVPTLEVLKYFARGVVNCSINGKFGAILKLLLLFEIHFHILGVHHPPYLGFVCEGIMLKTPNPVHFILLIRWAGNGYAHLDYTPIPPPLPLRSRILATQAYFSSHLSIITESVLHSHVAPPLLFSHPICIQCYLLQLPPFVIDSGSHACCHHTSIPFFPSIHHSKCASQSRRAIPNFFPSHLHTMLSSPTPSIRNRFGVTCALSPHKHTFHPIYPSLQQVCFTVTSRHP